MTVPNEIPSNNYIANGVVKKFSVTFDYETTDTLRIKLNGNEPPTDKYYIDDVDHSFNFYLPPSNGDIIYIYRETLLERDIDYDNNYNSFRPKTVNTDFDRVWRVMQESFEQLRQVGIDYDFVLNQVRPISTGGTGADNAEDARTNLNIYSKQEIVDYLNEKLSKSSNLSDLENIAEALTNISVYNKSEVDALVATGGQGNIVPVSGGGTGADNSEVARTNLEVPVSSNIKTNTDFNDITETGIHNIVSTNNLNSPISSWGGLRVLNNKVDGANSRIYQEFFTTYPGAYRVFKRSKNGGSWSNWIESETPDATETTAGKAKIATTAIAQAGVNDTDFITALKLKQTLGAGRNTLAGSVNFNGTGTVSIRSQLNVSSITDLGEGTYKINMTTAMPNANYPVFTSVADRSSESRYIGIEVKAQTTNSITVNTFATGTGGAIDVDFISVGWTI